MPSLSLLSDTELLAQVAAIVETERKASAEVIEHLMEVERRRLYLDQACSSLYAYCRERLGYSEDAALKRARVARLALRLPRALDAHNEHAARRVFGEEFIASKRAAREGLVANGDDAAPGQTPVRRPREVPEPLRNTRRGGGGQSTHFDTFAKVRSALTHMGFCPRKVASTLTRLHSEHAALAVEPLLREALTLLTPLSVVAAPP